MLLKALWLCITKHFKQKDISGKRYFWHPIHVALNVKGKEAKIVALLHDIIEDTDVSPSDLLNMGFSSDIVDAIFLLTKIKYEPYKNYIERIKQSKNKLALIVKIKDLEHNMNLSRLKNVTQKDLMRFDKYKKARYYLGEELKNEQ